ncbi:hypothetical protein BDF20DRAFT_917870 [Mycotypha africana]|uniref:uncharacterized protein n=1 Tax=Mycotypha africana TaxID=64632 RepID=UPI0023011D65|nr:uncharacterized protein BDF20DRAFT_917870 [Mycotypha africana]KAI8967064.1 hypothetical protein BDF20DRAFT_917870 [Mycotypha africana]
MDCIIEEGEQFNLRNLTNTIYKESQPVPTEVDPKDEDLESRISLATERLQKYVADSAQPSNGRSASGTPTITTTPSTKAKLHSILGAASAVGVLSIDVRVPQMNERIRVAGGRKRKVANSRKTEKKGTTTGHYLKFLVGTLDQLDKYPELKGFYLVMDNAHIHNHEDIERLITDRGRQSGLSSTTFLQLDLIASIVIPSSHTPVILAFESIISGVPSYQQDQYVQKLVRDFSIVDPRVHTYFENDLIVKLNFLCYFQLEVLLRDSLFPPKPTTTFGTGK